MIECVKNTFRIKIIESYTNSKSGDFAQLGKNIVQKV